MLLAGEIDFGEFLRLCRNESALPLKEILQYAATRPAQREPQAPTIPASPAAPVLEPLGVTMITSEAEFTAAMDAHPGELGWRAPFLGIHVTPRCKCLS